MPQYTGIWNLTQVSQAIQSNDWIGIKPPSVEYLIVAGGGGGAGSDGGSASNGGGGGGAGGLLSGYTSVTPGSSITVTIGAGGNAGASGVNSGSNGSNSVFGVITATGGGGGTAAQGTPGRNGGSGGGGGWDSLPGNGTPGQGNNGGPSVAGNPYVAGAGGGAGSPGNRVEASASSYIGNRGGAGIFSDISGTRTAYAGGGGGGGYLLSSSGAGGVGGGGQSGSSGGVVTAGTANTGGGGGGASTNGGGSAGGNGGSGIVIISYSDIYAAPASTSGGPVVSTSGSGSINTNTAARVTYANNAAYQFGTGNFTVEAFVYLPTISGYGIVAKCADDSSWANGWTLNFLSGVPQVWLNATNPVLGTSAVAINTWHHIAMVRSGTTLTLYINGTSVGTATNSSNIGPTVALSVGGEISSTSYALNGYISNLRVIKGVAQYTSNFTAPTAPLTAVSGTSLLLNTVSGSVFSDSSSNSFQPATAPNSPTWNQLSPFPTGFGYKNRVYTWTTTGTVTF